MKKVILLLIVLVAYMSNTFAQKPAVVATNEPGWHKIGQITASFKSTSESISVLGADEFTALKLKVTDAPITIDRLQVFYESGEMEEIAVSNELGKGAETRVINLKQPYRDIKKVAFTYHTGPNTKGEKATLELHGLKTNQPQGDGYRDEKRELKKDIDQAADETEREVKETEREAEREVNETEREIEKEAKETERELERETEEAEREAEKTERKVEREAEKTEKELEKETDEEGNRVSEAAGNTAAYIKDKPYAGKMGPNGQTIYIDKHSKYYYINDAGNKVYLLKSQLKNKPDKD